MLPAAKDLSHVILDTASCAVGEWSEWRKYQERTRTVTQALGSTEPCGEVDFERREETSRERSMF